MAIPTAAKVVAFAKKYVRAKKYGVPNQFTRWYYGNGTKAPWCAIFVYYCLAQTGGKTLEAGCANKAYCPSVYNWAKKKGYLKSPKKKAKKGDLVLYDWNDDKTCDHIGFVIKELGGGRIQTVEGNTSNTNNSNGGCVAIRTRSKSDVRGFVRLPYKKLPSKKSSGGGKVYPGPWPKLGKKGYRARGDMGPEVKKIQKFLNSKQGGSHKLAVDGSFGPATTAAVKSFQRKHGLTPDGSFGPKTLAKAKKVKK